MIKYLVIENEYFARMKLIKLVAAVRSGYRPAFCVESVEDAVELLRTGPDIDLIFMDVELVDGNCFDILKQVRIDVPVIFTTAYSDFAIKAFQLNSVDYLLKPLTQEAVEKAIDKFERFRLPETVCSPAASPHPACKSRILISEGDNYFYIPCEDISMARSEEHYVFIHTFSGKKHITEYANLSVLEQSISPEKFFRISRGIIVSIHGIVSVRKYFKGRLKVVLTDKSEVIVSSGRRDDFLAWLGGKSDSRGAYPGSGI